MKPKNSNRRLRRINSRTGKQRCSNSALQVIPCRRAYLKYASNRSTRHLRPQKLLIGPKLATGPNHPNFVLPSSMEVNALRSSRTQHRQTHPRPLTKCIRTCARAQIPGSYLRARQRGSVASSSWASGAHLRHLAAPFCLLKAQNPPRGFGNRVCVPSGHT